MENQDCIFCKVIRKEAPAEIIYEDESFIVFLDINPNNYGHSLIVPKEHHTDLYTIPESILTKLGPLIQKVSLMIKKGVQADGINVMMNNESSAGQLIFHAHLHVIPRTVNDEVIHISHKKYDGPEHMKEIGDKIRQTN